MDPVLVAVPEAQWTRVAANVRGGRVYSRDVSPNYRWTQRVPGSAAPVGLEGSTFMFHATDVFMIPESAGIDLWVYSEGADGALRVDAYATEFDVAVQDQTTEIVDLHLSEWLSDFSLTAGYAINDRVVRGEVDPGFVPLPGQTVCLKEGVAFYQAKIISASPVGGDEYDLELDSPLDFAYTDVAACSIRNEDLAVDGSTTPVEFFVSPVNLDDGVAWDIVRFIGAMLVDGTPDGTRFGDIVGGLTYGIVFRSENGIFKNIFNAKTNNDLAAHMYDLTYDDRAQPQSGYAVRFRRTFGGPSKNGVTVRINASTADKFVCIVQDDLTDLLDFQVIAQGHVVDRGNHEHESFNTL